MKIELMRRLAPANDAPRCGAKTRAGSLCRQPAVRGKRRCRMHGGAAGHGGQPGNKNALKTGLHTAEAIAWRRQVRALIRQSRELIEQV